LRLTNNVRKSIFMKKNTMKILLTLSAILMIGQGLFSQALGLARRLPGSVVPVPFLTEERGYARPSAVTVMALDSVVTTGYDEEKVIYEYDSLGRDTVRYVLIPSYTSSQWDYYLKISKEYTPEGDIARQTFWMYNVSNSSWMLSNWMDFYYNTHRRLDSVLLFISISPDPYEKWVYTYGTNGELLMEIQYYYDTSTQTFLPLDRYTYTYTPGNRVESITWQTYSQNVWTDNFRISYTYNSDGTEATRMYESYANGQWMPLVRLEFTYTSSQRPSEVTYATYDGNGMIPTKRDLFQYDSNDDINTTFSEEWNGVAFDTVQETRYLHDIAYSYDQLLLPLPLVGNTQVMFEETNYYLPDSILFNHQLNTAEVFDRMDTTVTHINYYYSSRQIYSSTPSDAWSQAIKVYPNPASETLFVSHPAGIAFDELVLYDAEGRELRRWKPADNGYFVGDLPEGMYLIKIKSGRNNTFIRFLKL